MQGEGFVENGQVRRIPFEVMVQGDKEPVYEETLQDNGRWVAWLGCVGMDRR